MQRLLACSQPYCWTLMPATLNTSCCHADGASIGIATHDLPEQKCSYQTPEP